MRYNSELGSFELDTRKSWYPSGHFTNFTQNLLARWILKILNISVWSKRLLHNTFSNTYLSRYSSDSLDYQCQHTATIHGFPPQKCQPISSTNLARKSEHIYIKINIYWYLRWTNSIYIYNYFNTIPYIFLIEFFHFAIRRASGLHIRYKRAQPIKHEARARILIWLIAEGV